MTEDGHPPHVSPEGELQLSNEGQLQLLRATMERGIALRMRAHGFSMKPFIRDGDVVTVVPMAGREPQVGDVVACVVPGADRLVMHRVVAHPEAGWLVRGDNCRGSDGVIAGDAILGTITHVERKGRDVDFGSGMVGAGIARLSRSGILGVIRGLRHMSRRMGASALRGFQGMGPYRAMGRRLTPRVDIEEVDARELRAAQRMYGPAEGGPPPDTGGGQEVTNWVARRKGKTAGFVQLVRISVPESPWAGDWLFSLLVKGRYRGLGIGEALTRRVIDEAQRGGAGSLMLVVYEDNERALRLHGKLGFAPCIVEALEAGLEAERQLGGRRRVVLRKGLGGS